MKKTNRILYQNKKARRKFSIIDYFEAGIVLLGCEIKSIRQKKLNFDQAYAQILSNELNLINGYIAPYQKDTIGDYEPRRTRKLLVKKQEINHLIGKIQKGFTIIPLKVYLKKNFAKVELAIVRGKKIFDHKKELKEKDLQKQMQRELKSY